MFLNLTRDWISTVRQQALKELDDTAKNKNTRDYFQNTISAKTGEVIKELDVSSFGFYDISTCNYCKKYSR